MKEALLFKGDLSIWTVVPSSQPGTESEASRLQQGWNRFRIGQGVVHCSALVQVVEDVQHLWRPSPRLIALLSPPSLSRLLS